MYGGDWPRARPPAVFRDVVPPLLLAGVLALVTTAQVHGPPAARQLGVDGYLLLAAAALSLMVRRRLPLLAYGASAAFAGAFLLLHHPPGPILLAPFLGLIAFIASTPSVRLWLAAALSGAAVLSLAHGIGDGWSYAVAIFAGAWLAVALVVGTVLDARRRFLAEVRARSRWAERSHEEEGRRRMVEERLRIAREMHDVVGHSLAVISLQAGVAEHLLDARPEEVRRAVAAIRRVSKEALGELRAELALLRGDGVPGGERRPTPDLGALAALVSQMREAGLTIDLRVPGGRDGVPEIVSRAAYRIVQESLTNVARHAGPRATATVVVEVRRGRLHVDVADDGSGAGATPSEGAGLQGMRERATALGGSFSAGSRAGGGFEVHASLPLGQP